MKRVACVWLPRWPIQRITQSERDGSHPARVLFVESGAGLRVSACCSRATRQGVIVGMSLAEAHSLVPEADVRPHDQPADHAALRELCWWCHRYTPLVGFRLEEKAGLSSNVLHTAGTAGRASSGTRSATPQDPTHCRERPLQRSGRRSQLGERHGGRSLQRSKAKSNDGYESLFLDLTGCAHLFGGEAAWAARVVGELQGRGFTVCVAVADTPGAAWAHAHHLAQPGSCVVATENAQRALDALPVALLRLPDDVVRTLSELDLRTIGAVRRLPRKELPSRFGPVLLQRLDQALGAALEFIVPERPPEPVEISRHFEIALQDRRDVAMVVQEAVDRLARKLRKRTLGTQRIRCQLTGPVLATDEPSDDSSSEIELTVGLVRPSAESGHLWSLLEMRLERSPLPAEVTSLWLRAEELRPPQARQRLFFQEEDGHQLALARLMEQLSSRLGDRSVLRPWLVSEHLPERAVQWAPVSETSIQREDGSLVAVQVRGRPVQLLLHPTAIQVISSVPEGPPAQFTWNGVTRGVSWCWGPERIETGWWRRRHRRRDYYQVETDCGGRFWLFRERDGGTWFVHGVFE